MTFGERTKAIERLRKAAQRDISGTKSWGTDVISLADAWREFPECERDESVPSPREVLEICDRLDAELAEAKELDQWVKGGCRG